MLTVARFSAALFLALASLAMAQTAEKLVDLHTRPGVSQRLLVLTPPDPKAAVLLLPGGHGGLQIYANGSMKWGAGNFLVRTRQLFAEQGLMVAVVDAPSDRQSAPYLSGSRQTPEHAADLKAAIAWMRENAKGPVWLVGTSRGTQSAAYVAAVLVGPEGPDGVVLSSTILVDNRGRPVPALPLDRIRVPVLVVHHEQDGCTLCPFSEVPVLMAKLANVPRSHLLSFQGGQSRGDPCEAFAHHGFNGLEQEVVQKMGTWMLAR